MSLRLFLAFLAAAAASAPLSAHAFLQRAQPGAGATLATAPGRISLVFTEKLEPVFSGVVVTDVSGRSVQVGAPTIGGNAMVVTLQPLRPGTYRVTWHAVSVDTHRTEGGYSFTVRP